MKQKTTYPGIDIFRFIAALLVTAIHTYPLTDISPAGDFILTRIIGRTAVPFFFFTTGFFLISCIQKVNLKRYVKKIIFIYAGSILLYLPILFYNASLKSGFAAANFFKKLLFNGTFYHLWYFPALLLGIAIICFLLNNCWQNPNRLRLAFSITLYHWSVWRQLLWNCRADSLCKKPLWAAEKKASKSRAFYTFGCALSLFFLLAEALTLHSLQLQRHDSMYAFLLPCMYYLFRFLQSFHGKNLHYLRDISLYMYLLHPLVIIVIRVFAKISGSTELFVENNLIHYFSVCIISIFASIVCNYLFHKLKKLFCRRQVHLDRAWLELNFENLTHNVAALCSLLPENCSFMAVVKANAYGHGAVPVSKHLNQIGVDSFAVATIEEGIELRNAHISGTILILGYTPPTRIKDLLHYQLTQTITNSEHATQLNGYQKLLPVHLKIDTGMHRLGENYENIDNVKNILKLKYLQVEGIYTHLSSSDSLAPEDISFTEKQINDFYNLLSLLRKDGFTIPKLHIQSSYGLLNYPELNCGYVRIGIALYGTLSIPNDKTKAAITLCPVLSLKARIVLVRTIRAGESVSYARQFHAKKDTVTAVLPIGYADGLPRTLSCEKDFVLIHGHPAPVIGRICMDQLIVDITEIPDVKIGDVATIIGKDGNCFIDAETVAHNAGTITNELLSRLGSRLERI